MLVPFQQLPANARTWIYQADRKISPAEKNIISEALTAFTEGWNVHGQPMETSFEILYDQFVVLAANDTASGCSIDTSVRAIKQVGDATGIDFFNRTNVAFLTEAGVSLLPVGELKKKYAEKAWTETTPVFNNLADTKQKLEMEWLAEAGNTWLKRYIPTQSLLP